MLDDVTKKRINTLRQILVGKLPDPKAQVEQITNGLIYKFMNDMDEQSVSLGGKASYFSGKFEKYSWKKLLNSKTSGSDRLELYKDAIEKMYNNENLPELFREIFKNSFLPFKDPSTLNLFLKEINEFNYSHSEKLGDAFEYLLSFMGSQGDAGQFRTPRHIIDFIVEIVNPQKNETILDPACGTAGFLISSYKHILNQNTKKSLGDGLTASDRKKIGENLNGYDISPDMVKMSLVNMYLHKFSNPKINEYDTLSSEDRWNEYYDVILANPPFFSPKGGIIPHNRFGVKSTKAEVLFVDYIIEHLKPNGRAGIIVPEGINFTENKAYTDLRKSLINNGLIADISMPHGIFKPYASVKTHILIIDKNISKNKKNILFIELENDGYTQTDTRSPIEGEELSSSLDIFNDFVNKDNFKRNDAPLAYTVSKDIINLDENSNLLGRQYDLKNRVVISTKNKSTLDEICSFKNGNSPNMKTKPGDYKLVVPAPEFKTSENFDFDGNALCIPLVSSAGHGKAEIKRFHYIEGKFALANTMVALFSKNEKKYNIKYLNFILSSKIDELFIPLMKGATNVTLNPEEIKNIEIPILNIEDQMNFVLEIESLRKIIKGCEEIENNFKPSFDIDKTWEKIDLEDLIKTINPKLKVPKRNYNKKGSIPVIDQSKNFISGYFDDKNYLVEINEPVIIFGDHTRIFKYIDFNFAAGADGIKILKIINKKILPKFLYFYLLNIELENLGYSRHFKELKKQSIFVPSIEIQERIINDLNKLETIVNSNNILKSETKRKIKEKTDLIWSN